MKQLETFEKVYRIDFGGECLSTQTIIDLNKATVNILNVMVFRRIPTLEIKFQVVGLQKGNAGHWSPFEHDNRTVPKGGR